MDRSGFTLIEIMIVVTIIAILLIMALPGFYRSRLSTRKTVCMNSLRQLEAAVDRWVFENDINEGISASLSDEDTICAYLREGRPQCPSGGTYTIGIVGTYPQVTCDVEGHYLN